MKRMCAAAIAASVLAAGSMAMAQTAAPEIKVTPNVLKNTKFKVPSLATAQHPFEKDVPVSSPKTYPLENDFQKRVDVLVSGLATKDLSVWRRGYFSGGDPGKYTHGPIMAKLLLNPQAEDAVKMQNDDRSAKEQYHFACVNWARFAPIFGSILDEKTQKLLDTSVGKYGYLGQGGTENHKTMWITSANVLPNYTLSGRLQNMGKDQALDRATADLRTYVKSVFAGGNGEWDSSTYMMFTMNGMMNIYDFAKNDEQRMLAKAALDWQATAYAIKYTDGVFNGPHQRGHTSGPVETIADRTGWLWWGSSFNVTPQHASNSNYAMHAATSSWRPNKVITNIATRNVQLPFEVKSSKPNYWGVSGDVKPGSWLESVYVDKNFTLASLWRGFGGQAMRMALTVKTPNGPVVFNGASPIGRGDAKGDPQYNKFVDGNGAYDQSAQVGSSYVVISNVPNDDSNDDNVKQNRFAFFKFDESVKPQQIGDWWVFTAGDTYVGVRGLKAKGELATTPPAKNGSSDPLIKFDGALSGFVLEVGTKATHPTAQAFAAALAKTSLDTSKLAADLSVTYKNLAGKTVALKYQKDQRNGEVSIDGQPLSFDNWPTYDSPYVKHNAGVWTITDGKDGYTIDFTGESPVYKLLK